MSWHYAFPFLALLRLDIAAAFFLASALLLAPHALRESRSLVGLPFASRSGPLALPMRARKLALRGLSPLFTGGFRFIPCRLAEALPLAFKPPLGFLPSLRCHAGVLAISQRSHTLYQTLGAIRNLIVPATVYHLVCRPVPIPSINTGLHALELGETRPAHIKHHVRDD